MKWHVIDHVAMLSWDFTFSSLSVLWVASRVLSVRGTRISNAIQHATSSKLRVLSI